MTTKKTITTDRPITLHGLCQVPDSFCDGIELCSIAYRNLVPEKTGTRLTDTCKLLVPDDWYQFLWCVLPAELKECCTDNTLQWDLEQQNQLNELVKLECVKVPSVFDTMTVGGKASQACCTATKNAPSLIGKRHDDGPTRAVIDAQCYLLLLL